MIIYIKRGMNFVKRKFSFCIYEATLKLPFFHFLKNTRRNHTPYTFKLWFYQKVLGFNRDVYWPVHFTSKINQYKHILVGVDSNPGIEPGCYIQGIGKIYIGNYVRIAQNVGIISSNHDLYDTRIHDLNSEVHIGDYSWIGMNAIVLPNVKLGAFTIVGAGSVVTKSFQEGYCVIAGNPAKIVKYLDSEKCISHKNDIEYIGYYPKYEFDNYRSKNLWI